MEGIITRYESPVLTAAHTPVFWRYALVRRANPYLMDACRHECNHECRCHQMERKVSVDGTRGRC